MDSDFGRRFFPLYADEFQDAAKFALALFLPSMLNLPFYFFFVTCAFSGIVVTLFLFLFTLQCCSKNHSTEPSVLGFFRALDFAKKPGYDSGKIIYVGTRVTITMTFVSFEKSYFFQVLGTVGCGRWCSCLVWFSA